MSQQNITNQSSLKTIERPEYLWLIIIISQPRRFYRIPIRNPKLCRIPDTEAIDRTITSASNTDWNKLVFFPILALGVPNSPSTTGSSLSSVIRKNLRHSHNLPAIQASSASSCRVIKLAESYRQPRASAPTSTLS